MWGRGKKEYNGLGIFLDFGLISPRFTVNSTVSLTLDQLSAPHGTLLTCPQLSLARYREVAAHLQQLPQVEATPMTQTAQQFDYFQSQVQGLRLVNPHPPEAIATQKILEILQYYGQQHQPWVLSSSIVEEGE